MHKTVGPRHDDTSIACIGVPELKGKSRAHDGIYK